MHGTEHQHDDTDLPADRLQHLPKIRRRNGFPQRQGDVADIDQIKADNQEVVNRIGQPLVAAKRINQKDAAVFVERVRDPDGERNAERDVNDVCPNDGCHNEFLSCCFFLMEKSPFSFHKLQSPGDHFALLGLRHLSDYAVSQIEKIAQGFELLVESGRFGAS